jgi:hypothetical protein
MDSPNKNWVVVLFSNSFVTANFPSNLLVQQLVDRELAQVMKITVIND